ncbi:hypothetical protein ADIS_0215 [Lunatimonas lonarensis]|uniref:Lipoprotein n=1 Tax=Lunatimonas lonarensis TaxID=1232681 RepID=R7ZYX2_9BACT|nr:hypothetical protein [Lunatimonas lonarensis]EON79290.1 hypothetical protein ADIS_0215 [Lunatimonas lonarensis]
MNRVSIKIGSLALLLGLLFSCSETIDEGRGGSGLPLKYFPLGDFLQDQLSQLDGKEVHKVLRIGDDRREVVRQRLDREGWGKELELFLQADLNKASLMDSYTVDETADRLTHRLKDGEPGDVREMVIRRENGRVLDISFAYKKDSYFYLSEGTGTLEIHPESGLIQGYTVIGRQKIWFLPTNTMEVTARVTP